jgi:hypothetical protein
MMIFKKAIPRRTFLRGLGATFALPLLDGMVPAFASAAETTKQATRLAIVTVPNGIIMDRWTPKTEGSNFELTPTLEPLASFQDQMLVVSGLNSNEARQLPGEIAGDHPRACSALLTGVHPKMTSGVDLRAGISVDQLAAQELGKHTQLASLELGIESPSIVGSCESAYSCAYYNTISWRTPSTPMPMENQPRAVFERLFGDSDSTDPKIRAARIRENRSLLDFVSQDASRLLETLAPSDRLKVNQYLDAVRDVERRIQMAEEQSSQEVPNLARPVGVPPTFTEHVKLMMDLEVLAFQSDLTRVATLMTGHEMSNLGFPEIGFGDPYHPLTHHQGDSTKIGKVVQVNRFHTTILAYFLDKLRSTPDGDGTLLDHSITFYGSPLSDGNLHIFKNLPILLVGGGSGQIKGGRHLRYPKDTPVANLYLTLLDKLGVPVESLGDSTGKLELLAV